MRTVPIPLAVLDLVPVPSGSNAREALLHTADLARRVEHAGYARYWLAEHHLNPGVAGTSPALVIGHVAAATRSIRVGSGAVQMGHHTPLSVVEQFGILDALHPGRIDLGLGRSGFRRPPLEQARPAAPRAAHRTERGLLIPEPFSFERLADSPRIRAQAAILQQPNAETPDYAEQVDEVLGLLDGTYVAEGGVGVEVVPGQGADLEVWVLGSSGGSSARVAGQRGLPFAANYHVSPSTVLEAVTSYRDAFVPGRLERPRVMVSADVVVGVTDGEARRLAAGYGLWVRSIRTAAGAIPFPTPEEAAQHDWSEEDRRLVQDRLDTQFVGSAATVADRLEVLAAETGADELLITTITHDHTDRVRSYELLAAEWAQRRPVARAS